MSCDAAMLGETVGSYRIVRELGRGGMGVVYEGQHVKLGSRAAVKVLLPRYSADEKLLARFFNEARAATLIRHPGIVSVFDFGHPPGGAAYLVMELLEGETLSARRKRVGRLPVKEALRMARQAASALAAAHRAGIVHRDVKPHNLFVVDDGDSAPGERLKVLDFGIAKLVGETAPDGSQSPSTAEGSVLGTPKYMSPEQCRGERGVDGRSDIYSLGCIVYELLCGEPPFGGLSHAEVIAQQLYQPAPRPSDRVAGLSPEVDALVLECLEKLPERRPASMAQVAERLGELAERVVDATASTPPPQALEPTKPGPSTTRDPAAPARLGRRWWRGLVALAVAVGAVIATVVVLAARSARRATPSLPTPVALREVTPAAPDAGPLVPGVVTATVTSDPPGAAVIRAADGAWLGQTPVALPLPRAQGHLDVELHRRGFEVERLRLPTQEDSRQEARLRPEPTRPEPTHPVRATGARTPPPAPAPAPPAAAAPSSAPIGDGFLDPFGAARREDAAPPGAR